MNRMGTRMNEQEMRERLAAAEKRADDAELKAKMFSKWANLGGVPSGRTCTYDPKDHHEVHGGGMTIADGKDICTLHYSHSLESRVSELTEELTRLKTPPSNESWKSLVAGAYLIPGDGARHVESITSHYNAMQDEVARLRTELAAERESATLRAALEEAQAFVLTIYCSCLEVERECPRCTALASIEKALESK